MSQMITAGKIIKTKELLTVGLIKDFGLYFKKSSPFDATMNVRTFNTSFSAFRWLTHGVKAGNENRLPKAIICDFTLLKEEHFLFFKNVASNSRLKHIPFIIINSESKDRRFELLELGIDDCYNGNIEWDYLVERIEFLEKYKPQFESQKEKKEEDFKFKMPKSKRFLDILIASLAILFLSPIIILVALLVKITSKGDVIYKSKRVGTGYQVFDFLKFRSMYEDADKRLAELKHLNQYEDDGSVFKKFKNDPRITPIGRFIRKTSIDELPQLFNVLKGEMSIVGNRPLPLYEAELLTKDDWVQRFQAPAGITGLWQISKRGKDDMSTEERIGLDIQYSKKYSFWYDLKIIFKTPFAMFQQEDV